MATVLRVKRRLGDQPQDALVFCKRSKLNNDRDKDEQEATCLTVPAIAKFAGTLKDSEEDVIRHLAARLYHKELHPATHQSCKDVLAKVHKETRENSAANRYKVLEGLRKLDTSNTVEFKDKVLTFIDVEDSDSLALKQDTASTECTDCVYDVYYVENEKDVYVDDHISIHTLYGYDTVWDTYREEESKDPFKSDDSNSESNWRNDYPDSDISSDSQSSFEGIMCNQSDSLSSDDEDEDFAYCVNKDDVELYGYKYARYKQRAQIMFNDIKKHETYVHSDDAEDSSESRTCA